MRFPKLAKVQLTQQHIIRHPESLDRFTTVRIWSEEWRAWWRPDGCGYTDDRTQSGLYDALDAFRRVRHCGAEKGILIVSALGREQIKGASR